MEQLESKDEKSEQSLVVKLDDHVSNDQNGKSSFSSKADASNPTKLGKNISFLNVDAEKDTLDLVDNDENGESVLKSETYISNTTDSETSNLFFSKDANKETEILDLVDNDENGESVLKSETYISNATDSETSNLFFSKDANKETEILDLIHDDESIKFVEITHTHNASKPNSEVSLTSASRRKAKSGKDLIKDRLSLAYFSLPKCDYLDYTTQSARTPSSTNLKRLTESPNTLALSKELNSTVTMIEEIAKETVENLCSTHNYAEKSRKDIEEKDRESSDDDDIVILDVIPSPRPYSNFHHASRKGSSKPNLNFAGEVGVKKSLMESETPGAKRELLKKALKDKINEKKEAAFIKNKQLYIERENLDNEDCLIEDFEKGAERNDRREGNLSFAGGCKLEERENLGSSERDDIHDDYESEDDESERERDYESEGDDEYDSGDISEEEVSTHSESESFKPASPEMAYGKSHNEALSGTVGNIGLSKKSLSDVDFFDSEAICFSLPSHQPFGGFASVESHIHTEKSSVRCETNSLKSSPDCSPVLKHESTELGNDETRGKDEIPVITLTSSDSEEKDESNKQIFEKKRDEWFMCVGHEAHTSSNPDVIFGSAVTKFCSGAFPSTPQNDLSNSPLYFNEGKNECKTVTEGETGTERGEYALHTHPHSEDNSKAKVTESPLKRAKFVKRKRAIIESSDEEGDEIFTDFGDKALQKSLENEELGEIISARQFEEVYADKDNIIREFFEEEAELSGEELCVSSDEDETGLDLAEKEDDVDVPENAEVLRNQIGQIHLQRMNDDDEEFLKRVKNDFLDEGEFHSGEKRTKKFSWANKDFKIEDTRTAGYVSSESEEDNTEHFVQQDKLKWKKEVSVDTQMNEPSETVSKKNAGLKMDIISKSYVKMADQDTSSSLKRRRGSLMNSEILCAQKIKEEASGVMRKQAFFVKNLDNPVPSAQKRKIMDANLSPSKKRC